MPRAIKAIKAGRDGVGGCVPVRIHGPWALRRAQHRGVDNDATLPLLARAAVAYARAGADVIAPSDMMDGRVAAIRTALDDAASPTRHRVVCGQVRVGVLRTVSRSGRIDAKLGDRRAYQMDSPNVREAIREAPADVAEGADMVMVKPAGRIST